MMSSDWFFFVAAYGWDDHPLRYVLLNSFFSSPSRAKEKRVQCDSGCCNSICSLGLVFLRSCEGTRQTVHVLRETEFNSSCHLYCCDESSCPSAFRALPSSSLLLSQAVATGYPSSVFAFQDFFVHADP